MVTIRDRFGMRVGYSDHTQGIVVALAAVALGACVIEKHFTLSRDMDGPDHQSSLEPTELKSLVHSIRSVEKALGSGLKQPSKAERENMSAVRKSIVASRGIRRGEVFTPRNLGVKRPAGGMNPMRWDKVMGKKAQKNFSPDEMISL